MATGKEASSAVIHECCYKCNSRWHSSNLTAAVTKDILTDEKVASYLKWCCVRYAKALDLSGRSLIHMAASKGRPKLLKFLLKHRDVNINEKDEESHYTPLHRSLFYGQLGCAIRLIELGASIQQLDLEDLTPLDHVMKDRPLILEYNSYQPCEVYVWGTNTNYTLGIGHHHSRANPEPLDMFRRQGISIRNVVMSKFHTVFTSSDGRVWTCGHGQGGRLGLSDELTTLTPMLVKVGNNTCKEAALGIDHTILLMDNSSVWSFGSNTYHQLGHSPPPDKITSPKAIKALKDSNIIGICAAKYHSAFWSKDQLYTCGLNGGQLGHIKSPESTVPVPKVVKLPNLKESTIKQVAASDGATAVLTSDGDAYLLYEYRYKKIASKLTYPKKICAVGGHLDHKTNTDYLQEKGGDELKVLILAGLNSVYVYQSTSANYCKLSLRRVIQISDIVLNKKFMLLTTADGEAFEGEIKITKKKVHTESTRKSSDFEKFASGYDVIKLKRIPHVHRGVRVTSDLKGRNFAVTQTHPKSGLLEIPTVESTDMKEHMKNFLETADEYDTLHDVVFEVEGVRFPAHRYIVSQASPVLEDMTKKANPIRITNVRSQIFRRILSFAYTRDCDFLQAGVCPVSIEPSSGKKIPDFEVPDNVITTELISAYEYNNVKRAAAKKLKEKEREKDRENPLKLLKAAARKFGISELESRLESVRYESGYIYNTEKSRPPPSVLKFEWNAMPDLWDVSLKAEDGTEIKAHKCILVSRLEYFNCMINGMGWLESSQKSAINLPIPSKVLQILVNYLYTDEAPELSSSDSDIAIMTLVVADQFFCTRLKEFAEVSLGNLMSLRNVTEIFQLAVTYNADQLKRCSMEFICLNLPAILELRSLEMLEDSTLEELTKFYRSWLPCMQKREIGVFENAPDESLVEMIHRTEPVSLEMVEEENLSKMPGKTPKKRTKKTRESERTRNASTGSITSEEEPEPVVLSTETEKEDEGWVKVVNHQSKHQRSAQAKARIPLDTAKLAAQPVEQDKFVVLNKPVVKPVQQSPIQELEKEFKKLASFTENDFPTLNASPPARTSPSAVSPKPSEGFKKFVKLSQKQRKRLATLSISEDEESPRKPEVKSAWGITKNESYLLVDIMKAESKASSQNSVLATSPPWQDKQRNSPGSSLMEVMSSERRERELIAQMKSKPLVYTQMEDKAMEDLLLLYNANDVTDERITVRRAEYEFVSPPVWVSSSRK